MPLCTAVDSQTGVVIAQAFKSVADCTGYVLLDKADYANYTLLQQIWEIPSQQDLSVLWAAGFSLPITLGLISWGVHIVANFFIRKYDD